jgi:hypothetical protein
MPDQPLIAAVHVRVDARAAPWFVGGHPRRGPAGKTRARRSERQCGASKSSFHLWRP